MLTCDYSLTKNVTSLCLIEYVIEVIIILQSLIQRIFETWLLLQIITSQAKILFGNRFA